MRQSTIAQRAFAQSLAELNEHLSAGNFERAITICDYLSINHPGAVRVLRARAQALERLGDVARALDDYKRVLDIVPTDSRAMTGAARCLSELGENDEARELAAQALDHDAGNAAAVALAQDADSDSPGMRREDVATARALFEGGAHGRAHRAMQHLLMRAPDRPDLKLVRAGFLWRSGRRVEAIEVCNAVLYEKADALPAHAMLGTIWRAAGAHALANVHEQALDRLDPDGVERAAWLGGEVDESVSLLQPDDPLAQNDLANANAGLTLDTAAEGSEPVRHAPGPFDTADEFEAGSSTARRDHFGEHTPEPNEASDLEPDELELPVDDLDPEPLRIAAAKAVASATDGNPEADEERAAWVDSLITSRRRAADDDDAPDEPFATSGDAILPVKKLDWSPFRKRDAPEPQPKPAENGVGAPPDASAPKPTKALDTERATQTTIDEPELNTKAPEPTGMAASPDALSPELLDVVARGDMAVLRDVPIPPWMERITHQGASTPVDLKQARWRDAPATLPEPVIPPAPARKRSPRRAPEDALALAREALANDDEPTAEKHYRRLVKHAELLNETAADLAEAYQAGRIGRGLQRVLGDAHMRLGDTTAALAAYGNILEAPAQKFKFKPMGGKRVPKPRA